MSASEPPPRTAPLALWRIAQAFLNTLYGLFGAPEDVAARHTLTRKPHALLAQWLRAGEALMRRLLLIEAAAIEVSAAPARQRAKRVRQRKLMHFEADQPETWRVTFSSSPVNGGSGVQSESKEGVDCAFPLRHRAARADTSPARGGRFLSAWPLAERYEALIRVFNNPHAYAKRLARKLGKAGARAVARLMHCAEDLIGLIGHASFDAADRAAFRAVQRLNSS